MRTFWFSLLLLVIVQATNGQAPGDENQVCVEITPVVNQMVLMGSFYYIRLLEANGGPWIVVDNDTNNDGMGGSSVPMVSETP